MTRSSLIAILIVVLLAIGAIMLGSVDTTTAPKTVEKDMLNAAAAQ